MSLPAWVNDFTRRIGGTRILALPLLRALAVLAGWLWIALAPVAFRVGPLVLTVTLFTIYSAALIGAVFIRPSPTLRLHAPVMVTDLGFALAMIYFSGGARSTLFLALLLIAGLQSYYYGLQRGLLVALATAAAYLALSWPTAGDVWLANMAIRILVLVGTAVGVGLIGELEQAERLEAHRLRQEASERQLFIRDVVESLGEGVVVLDDACRIMLLNGVVEARYGVVASDLVGRDYFRAFPELDGGRLRPAIDSLLRGEAERFVLEGLEHRRPSGERLVVDLAGTVFRRNGRPAGVLLVGQDVTQRLAFELSARRAEKLAALGTLAAGLAHELNNPIGIISSRIEVMLMEAEAQNLPPALREDLRVLQRHAARVARTARSLLSFARPGRGEPGPVDLNQVVEETLALAERQVSRTGVVIRRDLASGLPPIRGDADTLQQVVLNLVKNAADAIPGEGEIRIETRPADNPPGAVRLTVSDTGGGIAPEAIPKIFDPFYTTKADGTGLGLSVSHGIVRDHGGTIDVQSQPGVGTTFVLTFPVTLEGRNR